MIVGTPPRVRSVRAWTETLGDEAIEVAARARLELDRWQADGLRDILALDDAGRLAHFEAGVNVARQNGKGAILEVRELALLAGITGEKTGIHSAHEFATAKEHFERLTALTEESGLPIRKVLHSHGDESLIMAGGERIIFKARTKGGSRGFSGDLLVLDEAMVISTAAVGAMMPIIRASGAPRGPQLVYAGSAVDQLIHDKALVWSRIRSRGLAGDDPGLVYLEWSAPFDHPSEIDDPENREWWQAANPALGGRIDEEHMLLEYRSMDPRTFAVELLGVGDWPDIEGDDDGPVDFMRWQELADDTAVMDDPVVVAFDVSPDRRTAIVAAGLEQGSERLLIELVDSRSGTKWAPERLAQLFSDHDVVEIACDGYGPAASIANAVEELIPVKVTRLSSTDHGQACGQFVDAVVEGTMVHLDQDELSIAVRNGRQRPLGDAWAWSRKNSRVDIAPLVAATLSVHLATLNDLSDGEVSIY